MRGWSPYMRGWSPYMRGWSPYMRGWSPHMRGWSPYMRGWSPYMRGWSPYMRGWSPYMRGWSVLVCTVAALLSCYWGCWKGPGLHGPHGSYFPVLSKLKSIDKLHYTIMQQNLTVPASGFHLKILRNLYNYWRHV